MTGNRVLPAAAILWFGCMAGFFWSFSVVIMPGFDLGNAGTSLISMQDINVAVRNPLFGIGFFGAAAIAAALVVRVALARTPAALFQGGAALVYLVGVVAVTGAGNVPLNEALAVVDRSSADVAQAMADYSRDWSLLNHVRTISALAATALLTCSVLHMKQAEY